VELGYARVSTAKQDLERQIDALTSVGIAPERIYLDNKSGATVDRPGSRAVLGFARRGDEIVVHTLDRLGRTVRDTLNLIHELTEQGVGVRNLADQGRLGRPGRSDGATGGGAAGVVRPQGTYLHLRAGGARPGGGRRARPAGGRPSLLDPAVLAYAVHLRDAGDSMAQIVAKTGMTRSSLYRYLPPRRPVAVMAAQ